MKLIATNCAFLVFASVLAIMQTGGRSTATAAAAASAPPREVPKKKVTFEKVEFDSDPEWVVIEEAITMVGEDTAVNIQTNIKKSLPDAALISIELSKEKREEQGEFGLFMKSGDVPVCAMLKNATTQHPMFKGMIMKLLEFTNMPYQCPLPVGQFYLKEFIIDPEMIPSFAPEGRYKVNVGIFQPLPGHKLIYKTEIIFSLLASKGGGGGAGAEI